MVLVGSGSVSFDTDPDSQSSQFFIRILWIQGNDTDSTDPASHWFHASCLTPLSHASSPMPPVPRLLSHMTCCMSSVSCFMPPVSHLLLMPPVPRLLSHVISPYFMTLVSCFQYHISCLTSSVSCFMPHVSHLLPTSPVPCLLSHTSCPILPVPCLLSHLSCPMCPVLRVLSHIFFLTTFVLHLLLHVSRLLAHVSCLAQVPSTDPISHPLSPASPFSIVGH